MADIELPLAPWETYCNIETQEHVAQQAGCHEMNAILIPVFDPQHNNAFTIRDLASIAGDDEVAYGGAGVSAVIGSASLGVTSVRAFRSKFYEQWPLLRGLDWSNIVAAGGAVCAILAGADTAGDLDLFLYDVTAEQTRRIAEHVYQTARRNLKRSNLNEQLLVTRTRNAITFCPEDARSIQVVLRSNSCLGAILLGFDLDCVGAAFDGRVVHATPRTQFAFNYRANVAAPWRAHPIGSCSYEYRLAKYQERGFRIVIKGLPEHSGELAGTASAWRTRRKCGLPQLLDICRRRTTDSSEFESSYEEKDRRLYVSAETSEPTLLSDMQADLFAFLQHGDTTKIRTNSTFGYSVAEATDTKCWMQHCITQTPDLNYSDWQEEILEFQHTVNERVTAFDAPLVLLTPTEKHGIWQQWRGTPSAS